jgi:hypothetical protein
MSPTRETSKELNSDKKKKAMLDSASAQEATPNVSDVLAAELNQTDLGHLINEYKNVVIALVVIFIASAIGYASWKVSKSSSHASNREVISEFKNKFFIPGKEKDTNLNDLYTNYQDLVSKSKSGAALMELTPTLMDVLKKASGLSSNDWPSALKKAQDLCGPKDYCYLHFALASATILEEQSKIDEAIKTLEPLVGNPFVVEDRLYFDLVRLSGSVNNTEKKKNYLDILRKNHSSSEYKVLAEQL